MDNTKNSIFLIITDWHHERIVLNDYAEIRVQIAFVHRDRSDAFGPHESSDWCIDEVIVETPCGRDRSSTKVEISPPSGYYGSI
ncbi:hypothetical protein DSCA_20000 [Desulfosarcina alkanivorans]|uniref:Uncharacterized protein n=1 Tax=Desulfosarcina alkanivorans TaxID=571177 RepID=A0A5K7YIX8_9BACT|nr:hypothetical protein [Desulfosarcina alkanivorans]BBO68070.1 hypothetical protein DSCA_20000 [Desulfosarcina alkanivorans]